MKASSAETLNMIEIIEKSGSLMELAAALFAILKRCPAWK
jgi:hypothetical protein